MDVGSFLASKNSKSGAHVELTGWLVDTNDGLCVLGDHSPEDYDYPVRVQIANGNIMYPILKKVPSLGGGWSLLFHKAKICGVLECETPCRISVKNLSIEIERGSGYFSTIDVDQENVASFVREHGDYEFNRQRNPMRDWLND